MANDPTTDLKKAIETAKKLLFENAEVNEALQKIKDITFKTVLNVFPAMWTILKTVVVSVEIVYQHYQLCTKEERIEVAAEIIDDLFEFKGWLSLFEPFDGLLFKLLLSAAVQAINERVGNDWFSASLSPIDLPIEKTEYDVRDVFKIV